MATETDISHGPSKAESILAVHPDLLNAFPHLAQAPNPHYALKRLAKMQKKAGFDFHGTIAEVDEPFYRWLQTYRPWIAESYSFEDITRYPFLQHINEQIVKLQREFLRIPGEVANLQPYPDSLESVRRLAQENIQPMIISGSHPSVRAVTFQWLKEQGFARYIAPEDIHLRVHPRKVPPESFKEISVDGFKQWSVRVNQLLGYTDDNPRFVTTLAASTKAEKSSTRYFLVDRSGRLINNNPPCENITVVSNLLEVSSALIDFSRHRARLPADLEKAEDL